MNKKGSLGAIMLFVIAVVVSLALIPTIAQEQQKIRTEYEVVNDTITWPANFTALDLEGKYAYDFVAYNSSGLVISDGNYTVLNEVFNSDGDLTAQIFANDTTADFRGASVNVTYTYRPLTYANDSGSRSIASLITLFAALGILGAAVFFGAKQMGWLNK